MELNNIKETKNIIERIEKGSIAEEIDLEKGDILLSINDQEVKDIIDYKYLISDNFINIKILKNDRNEIWEYDIEKEIDEDLGLFFTNPLIDKAKSCKNKCIFCFIDQLPKNMRKSLYFKDDDSRLSFLQGNFITLTNMTDEEISRIIRYRLSPINVSVHTTNPDLRIDMLSNKNAGKIYDILKRFYDAKLEVNCQIVLVPGINDGNELDRTIKDLEKLHPYVKSVAIVPVGITKHREGLEKLKVFNKDKSIKVIEQISNIQNNLLKKLGTRFVFLGDEFYVLADKKIPEYSFYEGFPQYENGVGLMRVFYEEVKESISKEPKYTLKSSKKIVIVTGTLAYEFMCNIIKIIKSKFLNLDIEVKAVENNHFGTTITVSGLVTGKDIINSLKNTIYDIILIPKSMLKFDEEILLDDYTVKDLEKELNKKVIPVDVNGSELINTIKNEVI